MDSVKITVDEWKNIPAGTSVDDGFGGFQTAPDEEGLFTLFELVDCSNIHAGWQWERQVEE